MRARTVPRAFKCTTTRAHGVGGLWGGNPVAPPVPPRCLQLGEFGAQSVEAEVGGVGVFDLGKLRAQFVEVEMGDVGMVDAIVDVWVHAW
eukprot:scaffold29898_cov26-Tisochrysis_lutea.AAC.4